MEVRTRETPTADALLRDVRQGVEEIVRAGLDAVGVQGFSGVRLLERCRRDSWRKHAL